MLILLLHPQNDPAVVGWNLYKSIRKYTSHEIRHIVGIPTLLPHNNGAMVKDCDLIMGTNHKNCNIEEIENLIQKADVLHFSQWDWTKQITGTNYKFQDLMSKKNQKIIFQGHGGAWLLNPDERMNLYKNKNVKVITCSPIDEKVIPGAEWMPNILGLDDFDLVPNWGRNFNEILKAGLANSSPLYKGGGIVEYIFEYLNKFGYKFDFKIVKNLTKKESLFIRQNHHFTVDNWTQGFFGQAGLEGMALGHVVFARMDALAIKNWSKKFREFPTICNIIGMDECAKKLREYYNDRDLLKEHCQRNRKWIETNYTDKIITKMWEELYEK